MPQPPLSEAKAEAIWDELHKVPRLSHELIARKYGVGTGTVAKVKTGYKPVAKEIATVEPLSHEAVRGALKKAALSVEELADELDCSPRKVRETLEEMKARGVMLHELHGKYELAHSITLEPGVSTLDNPEGTRRIGLLGDNHLCNKHSRLDVLKAAYDYYERRGITEVYNTGNWIDGEARFNKTELVTRPGMDSQIEFFLENYPERKGITTHYIAGDDHEGWYQQREGVEIGRYLQLKAEAGGRHDLKYLGYGECDVKLQHGSGSSVMRIVHPGGGSSYAISYTDQKRVESYQGGEKPQIEAAGHYHKFNVGYPRGIWTVQTGCTCDQTMFMRKKRLEAHVGFLEATITQGSRGEVTSFAAQFFPYYDRGFYEKRF